MIRQCWYIDTNPWFIHKNKFIPVVTWKFELLKTDLYSKTFMYVVSQQGQMSASTFNRINLSVNL